MALTLEQRRLRLIARGDRIRAEMRQQMDQLEIIGNVGIQCEQHMMLARSACILVFLELATAEPVEP